MSPSSPGAFCYSGRRHSIQHEIASMFRIKICGMTRVEDARLAVETGADAIGLNFYEKSPRFLSLERAQAIASAVSGNILQVGIFVNASTDEIWRVAKTVRLDAVQLHGDEPSERIAELEGIRVIRARRMDERGVAPIAEDLAACHRLGRLPDAVLVDAAAPGQYGGSGTTVPWTALEETVTWLGEPPLILAGGLAPGNVAEAIRIVGPNGVDVASGVESSPGVKDRAKVREFVDLANQAFKRLA